MTWSLHHLPRIAQEDLIALGTLVPESQFNVPSCPWQMDKEGSCQAWALGMMFQKA